MNERIRELIDQSITGTSPEWLSRSNAEKLAELIILECARVANLTEDYDTVDYKSGRQWASFDIKNHFGFEE